MVVTLCTSGSVKLKAGTDLPTFTDDQYTEIINQAEGQIIADTRVNWVSGSVYDNMNPAFRQILQSATAAKAAISVINYDMLGYGSVQVATTMVNVLLDEYDRAVAKLKDQNIYSPFGGSPITT